VPREKDVCVSGGIAPHILNLNTRRRRDIGFTLWLLCLLYSLDRRLWGRQPSDNISTGNCNLLRL